MSGNFFSVASTELCLPIAIIKTAKYTYFVISIMKLSIHATVDIHLSMNLHITANKSESKDDIIYNCLHVVQFILIKLFAYVFCHRMWRKDSETLM